MTEPEELTYSNAFWAHRLPPNDIPNTIELKVQLVFSLIVYLVLPLHHLLVYIFSSNVSVVKECASKFMAYRDRAATSPAIFHPASLFRVWHEHWPTARRHLHDHIVQPCAEEIALQESDNIIQEPSFQIRTRKLTIAELRHLVNPQNILATIREKAPFTYGFLLSFTSAPNEYRKRRAKRKAATSEGDTGGQPAQGMGGDDSDSECEEEDGMRGAGGDWKDEFPGFSRNPVFVSGIYISDQSQAAHRRPSTMQGYHGRNMHVRVRPESCNQHPSPSPRTLLQDFWYERKSPWSVEQHWPIYLKPHSRACQGVYL